VATRFVMLKSSFARRIVALFFFCAFLPTAAVVVSAFVEVTEQLREQASARLRGEAKNAGMGVLERLVLLEEELSLVSSGYAARERLNPTELRGFEQIDVLAASDESLAVAGLSRPSDKVIAHLEAGGSHVVVQPLADGPCLHLMRWLGPGDRLIVGRIDSERLFSAASAGESGSRTRLCVVAEGEPVFCDPELATVLDSADTGELVDAVGPSWVAGEWSLFLTGRFHTPPWTIVRTESEAEVMLPLRAFERQFPLLAVGLLLLVLLASMTQIRRSLMPLAELRRGTRRVADGDFETQVEITSGDEFAELGVAFNRMAERLDAQFRALSSLADNERVQRERAEDASRSKTEFLANMSHELRTPMTAILGFADTLLDDSLTDDERRAAIDTVTRNGRQLVELIDEILDASRLESGALEFECSDLSMSELANEVVELLEPRARAAGLELSVVRADGAPDCVQSDRRRLRQILINLVDNAIKFTPEGQVKVVLAPDPSHVGRLRVAVTDTGIGIAPEHQHQVFGAFWQVDASLTREVGGTGLGLSIARSLAELLGSRLELESEPGEGTTFSVSLEAEHRELGTAGAAGSDRDPADVVRGTHILVAEDNPDNQRLIRHILEKAGAEVELEIDGRMAHRRAMERQELGEPFDAILMDMQMPVLDGYEATRALRFDGYEGAIIALTAHAMSFDRDRCVSAGCDDYATKPIRSEELIALIANVISKPG